MRSFRAWIAFALALAWFSVRASTTWLASGYVDPVGHFGTQDEAFYTRVVIEMLRRGNWLTPTLLDRLAYFKPPLLYWLSATSVWIFGPSRYVFRLPSLLAGAGICALAFHWVDRKRGIYPAMLTLLLLAGDGYMIVLSSVHMMDALAAFCALLALWAVNIDCKLERPVNLVLCAVALAGGLLTKSVAGVMPALAILVSSLLAKPDQRPKTRSIVSLITVTVALAAPWFLYSLLTHGRWFWDEHVLTEIFSGATGAGPLSTADPNVTFYALRFFLGDPVTAMIGTVAIGAAFLRRRADLLLWAWLIVTTFTLLLFRQHAATYLLPVVVATSIVFGLSLPNLDRRVGISAFAALLICETIYLSRFSPIVWTQTNNPQARALVDYCGLRRSNALFLIQPQDEFYSVLLPIPRMRYGMIDQGRSAIRQPIDWRYLGVIVTLDQFANQEYWWPRFRKRLNDYQLSANLDPRATTVLLSISGDHGSLIASHPELDFYVPESWSSIIGDHDLWAPANGRVWLLSRKSQARESKQIAGADWACRL